MSEKFEIPPTNKAPPPSRNRKRLARTALLNQLKRVQKVCGTLETPDQWYDSVKGVQETLNEYGNVLPPETLKGLNDALVLADPTRVGLQKACELLDNRLADAISALPGGGLLAPIALAATLVVAVIVFVGVVFLNANSVELEIVNRNCQAILIAGDFPGLDWLGMELPREPIAANATGIARLMPISLTVDATDSAHVKLLFGVVTVPVGNSSALQQISFNGNALLGKLTPLNLGEKKSHELVALCK